MALLLLTALSLFLTQYGKKQERSMRLSSIISTHLHWDPVNGWEVGMVQQAINTLTANCFMARKARLGTSAALKTTMYNFRRLLCQVKLT